jgi:hypothetical protein
MAQQRILTLHEIRRADDTAEDDFWLRLLSSCRIDHGTDSRNPTGRKTASPGMFTHRVFIGSDIDAIDFVIGDIALYPLSLRPQAA